MTKPNFIATAAVANFIATASSRCIGRPRSCAADLFRVSLPPQIAVSPPSLAPTSSPSDHTEMATSSNKETRDTTSKPSWCADPMDGSLPSCTLEDFKRPQLRQCPLDMDSISFTRRINAEPNYNTNDRLDGGADGYNWVVRFEEGGPEFVLKVVGSLQAPFV